MDTSVRLPPQLTDHRPASGDRLRNSVRHRHRHQRVRLCPNRQTALDPRQLASKGEQLSTSPLRYAGGPLRPSGQTSPPLVPR